MKLMLGLMLFLLMNMGWKNKDKLPEMDTSKFNETELIGNWIEAGIDSNGYYFKLPPRRGGLKKMVFLEENKVEQQGALNCGFGSKYVGEYRLEGDELICNYTKEVPYMNKKGGETTIDKQQIFKLLELNEDQLLLETTYETGQKKCTAFIRTAIWETLESNERLEKPAEK